MKATTWLCPVLTLLCATKLVYTAQREVSYGNYYHPSLDGLDSNAIQNDYFLSKRNKPSLSIVNPLDVLRQRLLLEIARRQMKENTRQVELNRAILKNVGKRMFNKNPYSMAATSTQWEPMAATHEQQHGSGNIQQQQEMGPMHLQQPYDLELIPSTLIFDYLQRRRPWLPYEKTSMSFNNYDIDDDNNDADDDNDNGEMADNAGDEDARVATDVVVQPANGHETTLKKPINRIGHEGQNEAQQSLLSPIKEQHKTFNHAFKFNDLTTLDQLNDGSNVGHGNQNSKNKNVNNDDYQVQRYLYHLHKNHLTRK